MNIDRAKEVAAESLNDTLFGEVGDDTLALDLALDKLVSLPAQEFMDLMCSYGYDQSPRDVAWHKFGDQALKTVREDRE